MIYLVFLLVKKFIWKVIGLEASWINPVSCNSRKIIVIVAKKDSKKDICPGSGVYWKSSRAEFNFLCKIWRKVICVIAHSVVAKNIQRKTFAQEVQFTEKLESGIHIFWCKIWGKYFLPLLMLQSTQDKLRETVAQSKLSFLQNQNCNFSKIKIVVFSKI